MLHINKSSHEVNELKHFVAVLKFITILCQTLGMLAVSLLNYHQSSSLSS